MSTTCMPGAYKGQKRASDPLGWALLIVTARKVLEIKSRSSARQQVVLNSPSHLSIIPKWFLIQGQYFTP